MYVRLSLEQCIFQNGHKESIPSGLPWFELGLVLLLSWVPRKLMKRCPSTTGDGRDEPPGQKAASRRVLRYGPEGLAERQGPGRPMLVRCPSSTGDGRDGSLGQVSASWRVFGRCRRVPHGDAPGNAGSQCIYNKAQWGLGHHVQL